MVLHRPEDLKDMTYPDFLKWWRKSSNDENNKGEAQSGDGDVPDLGDLLPKALFTLER